VQKQQQKQSLLQCLLVFAPFPCAPGSHYSSSSLLLFFLSNTYHIIIIIMLFTI
jgi:hypothetical protein